MPLLTGHLRTRQPAAAPAMIQQPTPLPKTLHRFRNSHADAWQRNVHVDF